ncbi:hypothetical protein COY16_04975 [Candidatus Roizmanbacteria bacterium CG_4_10_14_0_2_um_filter_39_13]|uniref:Uncharacterized protein n=1 Tax=Candidatus Roizmanbacteria bacterium CG_4_10_14_0_2_um_filter_39_13 TaxID=1974825 RepID=A0A2M7TWQ8_9BACT|nr:MAG: hypothetical protein COY16_04975 [Candidatus Roizmanbacteria bacterium CG_4_10_14_0_2_um_filter_39_13]
MENLTKILTSNSDINYVNNVSNNIKYNNVNNDIFKKRYALDPSKFNPNTEETAMAEEIAKKLDDLNNYAYYLSIVNKKGCEKAKRCLHAVLSDIKEKKNTKTPVRDPKKYYVWKMKRGLY